MLVYVGIFSALCIGGMLVGRRIERLYILSILLFLLWFMGVRYYVGCDFTSYMHRYNLMNAEISLNYLIFEQNELGFWFLTYILKTLELHYYWVNITASFIVLICFWVFLWHHQRAAMILALLFPVVIVQLGMSGIRQGMAVALLMVATVAWTSGRGAWTAIWILIGSLFHASVIMFLPIAIIANKRVSTIRLILAAGLIGPIAFLLLGDRFDTYAERYVSSDTAAGGAIIRYILIIFPVFLFSIYRKKIEENYPENYELFRLFSIISIAIFPLLFVSTALLHRLNYYVMPISIVIFVYVTPFVLKRASSKFSLILPAAFYGLYSVSWFLTSNHAQLCYIPYDNYLLHF